MGYPKEEQRLGIRNIFTPGKKTDIPGDMIYKRRTICSRCGKITDYTITGTEVFLDLKEMFKSVQRETEYNVKMGLWKRDTWGIDVYMKPIYRLAEDMITRLEEADVAIKRAEQHLKRLRQILKHIWEDKEENEKI